MLVSVYYFLPQPKGYLGVHFPPYGGGAGGRGTSMSFITYVIMTSVHYVIMTSASLLLYLYILSPLCLYVILASASLLLCLLHTQPLMSLCHYVFRSSVTMSFTYSVPYVFMSFWLLFHCYYVFTYSVPYVFMSFWLHKCKVFLQTSYFVGNL